MSVRGCIRPVPAREARIFFFEKDVLRIEKNGSPHHITG